MGAGYRQNIARLKPEYGLANGLPVAVPFVAIGCGKLYRAICTGNIDSTHGIHECGPVIRVGGFPCRR